MKIKKKKGDKGKNKKVDPRVLEPEGITPAVLGI